MPSDSHNPPDARVRELEAEVERLREALTELYAYCNHLGLTNPVMRVAREALEAGER